MNRIHRDGYRGYLGEESLVDGDSRPIEKNPSDVAPNGQYYLDSMFFPSPRTWIVILTHTFGLELRTNFSRN